MKRDLENEFGQDDDRIRSRSRRRDTDGDFGAGSDTPVSRRPKSGPDDGGGNRSGGNRSGGQAERPAPGLPRQRQGQTGGSKSRTSVNPAGREGAAREGLSREGAAREGLSREGVAREGLSREGAAGPERRRYNPGASPGKNKAPAGGGASAGRNAQDISGRRPVKEPAAGDKAAGEPKRHYRALIITLILLEFLIILPGIFATRLFLKKYNMLQRDPNFNIEKETNPNLNVEKVANMKGYWTVALFGVDSRNNSVGKGNNADVIIIANVNQENEEIKLVSVFRDSYLNLDDQGSYNKINQAYFRGGPELAIKALNKNLDIQIDDYATFNWKAVADAINILGGVDVNLTKAEFYYINAFITETVEGTGVGSHQLKSAGPNHLDGVQAVAYARLRKMDTDFARTERQRAIIQKCFDKLQVANFSVINNVMEVVFKQILTSVTLNDIIPAARNIKKYKIADTIGFPMQRGDANMGKKGDCVIPQTLESNVVALHKFLFNEDNYQPSDMVKKISAKISADTGMYNEGRYIDHVGTDGGYIPKPTASATKAAEESTKSGGSKESTSQSGEGIIDGENEWELETDDFGNIIDPPEGGYPDGYPGTSQPSGDRPGAGTSPGIPYPGYTTSPSEGGNAGGLYPGSTTSPGGVTGPGSGTSGYPGNTDPTAPGNTGPTAPGNTGPTAPGNIRPTAPGNTNPTAPGNTNPTAPGTKPIFPGNTGGTGPTTSDKPSYPGTTNAGQTPYPGSTDGYVPNGPGSVIIGPGN